MEVPAESKQYRPEEYLALEETAEGRSEYRDGEIVEMMGGTTNHNRLVIALCTHLNLMNLHLVEPSTEIFASDVKLHIPNRNLYTYPDVMVIESEPVYSPGRQDVVENPCVLVEVLSKSTQVYDQNEKFAAYRTIPTLREYVMIDQYRYGVKQFVRSDDRDRWIFSESVGESAVLQLETWNFEISFADLYRRVSFAAES